jgi:hypothetical protein
MAVTLFFSLDAVTERGLLRLHKALTLLLFWDADTERGLQRLHRPVTLLLSWEERYQHDWGRIRDAVVRMHGDPRQSRSHAVDASSEA